MIFYDFDWSFLLNSDNILSSDRNINARYNQLIEECNNKLYLALTDLLVEVDPSLGGLSISSVLQTYKSIIVNIKNVLDDAATKLAMNIQLRVTPFITSEIKCKQAWRGNYLYIMEYLAYKVIKSINEDNEITSCAPYISSEILYDVILDIIRLTNNDNDYAINYIKNTFFELILMKKYLKGVKNVI